MTDISSSSWSQIDASNNQPAPAGAPELMAPSGVNDTMRAMMAATKRWHDQVSPTVVSAGSANAQTLTYPVPPVDLIFGDSFTFIPGFGNSGPATLQIVGVGVGAGAREIVTSDLQPLVGREIESFVIQKVYWDGARFRLHQQMRQRLDATLNMPGFLKHPGGLIAQWGTIEYIGVNNKIVDFPMWFPTQVFGVQVTLTLNPDADLSYGVSGLNTHGFQLNLSLAVNGFAYWHAYGV